MIYFSDNTLMKLNSVRNKEKKYYVLPKKCVGNSMYRIERNSNL